MSSALSQVTWAHRCLFPKWFPSPGHVTVTPGPPPPDSDGDSGGGAGTPEELTAAPSGGPGTGCGGAGFAVLPGVCAWVPPRSRPGT